MSASRVQRRSTQAAQAAGGVAAKARASVRRLRRAFHAQAQRRAVLLGRLQAAGLPALAPLTDVPVMSFRCMLDKQTVARLTSEAEKAGTADVIHFDEKLSGFGLRLRRAPSGRLLGSYVAQYKSRGHTRRLKVGSAEKLSAKEARQAARNFSPRSSSAATRRQRNGGRGRAVLLRRSATATSAASLGC